MVSVATVPLFCCRTRTAIDNPWINACDCVPVKLYLQTQGVEWSGCGPLVVVCQSLAHGHLHLAPGELRAEQGSGSGSHSSVHSSLSNSLAFSWPFMTWCAWVLSWCDSVSPENKVPISHGGGKRGERVSSCGTDRGIQKLRRQTTHSSGVIPMPPSCLPLSLVPSRAKARFCWANWFCYNPPTPNMEVIMFFTLSPFTFFFIKFWNISCIQKGIKTIRVSPLYSPPNKKKHNITNRDRGLRSCSPILYTFDLGKMCGNC